MLKRNSEFISRHKDLNELPVHTQNREDELLNLRDILQVFKRRSSLIANCILFFTALAVLYLVIVPPKYTSYALVLIEPKQNKVLDVESVVAGIGSEAAAIESQLEILKSRPIASNVIDKLQLDLAGASSPLSAAKNLISNFFVSSSDKDVDQQLKEKLEKKEKNLQSFADNLVIKRRGLTYVIEVGFTSTDPDDAAMISNAIGEMYLTNQLDSKYHDTERANKWLQEKLADMREKVRIAEKNVESYKAQHNLVDAGGQTLGERQIEQVNQQLILARAKTAENEAKYMEAQKVSKRGGQLSSVGDALQSQVVAALRKQLAEVGRKEAEFESRYGPKHPTVINIQAEKRDIRIQINDEVERIVQNLKNEYEVSKSHENSLQESLEQIKQQNSVTNQASIKLRELQREAEAEKAAFNSFLNRFKETTAQQNLQAADARIIEKASPPVSPSKPNKSFIMAFALLLGGAVGVGAAFMKEYFDNVYRIGAEIEEDFGLPHLATIPLMQDGKTPAKSKKKGLKDLRPNKKKSDISKALATLSGPRHPASRLVIDQPLSSYSEAIRSLRISSKLAQFGAPPQVIMMVSALPNEGKTTTSLNLAHYASLAGEKTLLIDADIRNPSLTRQVAPNLGLGLLNILEGSVGLPDVCVIDQDSGLHFLPNTNKIQLTQPSEILASQAMIRLLNEARSSYDLIILDVSPLLPVIDAQVLLPHVDKSILVVEWGVTSKDAVHTALKMICSVPGKALGVVLNKAIQDQLKYYDAYGSGGYYGQYGYQYGAPQKA